MLHHFDPHAKEKTRFFQGKKRLVKERRRLNQKTFEKQIDRIVNVEENVEVEISAA